MFIEFDNLILRFRDLVTEEHGTIERHQSVITQCGYVWWGWWKKGNETTPFVEFSVWKSKAESDPIDLFLVDSGQNLVYKAKCTGLQLRENDKLSSPERDATPKYYQDKQCYAWFKFTSIDLCDEAELKKYSYVHSPSLFIDKNVDYSKFENKKIYSIAELIQQNRTVWFVRNALDTDPDNEIILLNSEFVQPAHFSTKYYQSSGNTLLWLSDLHLSDTEFKVNRGGISQTLAEHIYQRLKTENEETEETKIIAGTVISGDITSCANPEGFTQAKNLVRDLSNEFLEPISSENFIICPGNHDFVREEEELENGEEPAFIYDKMDNARSYADFYKSIYNIAPNKYFAMGRKILLSSGYMLEIAALNSLMLQQYLNFQGHGYLSQNQLNFVAEKMGWNDTKNENAIRIVVMHHHYLPTCYTEKINATYASSAVYDADRLMNWLVQCNVKLLLHGHKHKAFISQINYPQNPQTHVVAESMHNIVVAGMGGTGAKGVQNKFATIQFRGNKVAISFHNIYSDESERDCLAQKIELPL